jgi:glycosyltransferase involved in cell wall biosynthesis
LNNNTPPKILVIALARINKNDSLNNNLLLRNIFGAWPRERLAQIYSSGDNGDEGFFCNYYQLGAKDRYFGRLFYLFKTKSFNEVGAETTQARYVGIKIRIFSAFKTLIKKYFIHTGIYESIFQPKLSKEMLVWIKEFNPDIIFAQGYNLTFARLPVMVKEVTNVPIAFLTTDDWPTYLYSGQLGEPTIFRKFLKPLVDQAVQNLISKTDIPFAFGQSMTEEYTERYKKNFLTLLHSDDSNRFDVAIPHRCHSSDIYTILVMGNFNQYRWPLLLDINECCQLLDAEGIKARVAVISAGIDEKAMPLLERAKYIDIFDDPGNDLLPGYLKGADLLILAESFDESFVSAIKFSVSTKSHLFMFSNRPILVYGHSQTGVVRYASLFKWACVVDKRDVNILFNDIKNLLTETKQREELIVNSTKTANMYHSLKNNQENFSRALQNINLSSWNSRL